MLAAVIAAATLIPLSGMVSSAAAAAPDARLGTGPRAGVAAANPVTSQVPLSVWVYPQAPTLDGVGTWVVPLNEPEAGPGQLAPEYFYAHTFWSSDQRASGTVALRLGAGGKQATFRVTRSDGGGDEVSVAYPWAAGKAYFLLVVHLGGGQWGAWVIDDLTRSVTPVGALNLSPHQQQLFGATLTHVSWSAPWANDCADYPLAQAFVVPAFGFVAGQWRTSQEYPLAMSPAECGAVVERGPGWVYYEIGVAPPVATDVFASAPAIPSAPFTMTQNSAGAALESGEPRCSGLDATVWFSFTPASDRMVVIDTFGSSYDTVLAVHTGSSLETLDQMACSDNTDGGAQSEVVFDATAGTTYRVQVGGKSSGAAGHLVFHLAAGINPSDHRQQVANLETLTRGWTEAVANAANSIIIKPYTADELETFFRIYLDSKSGSVAAHPLNEQLWDYLGYRVLFWDAFPRVNLQEALVPVLLDKLTAIVDAHPTDLGSAMAGNADLRDTLVQINRTLGYLTRYAHPGADPGRFVAMDARYRELIARHPDYLADGPIDEVGQPYVAGWRAGAWGSFVDALPVDGSRHDMVATTLGLSGPKLAVWNAETVLLSDNSGLGQAQWDTIADILAGVPEGISDLRHVTVRDFLCQPGWDNCGTVEAGRSGVVNIFGIPVADWAAEQSFPPDSPPCTPPSPGCGRTSTFGIVVVHEANHRVTTQFERNPVDGARRDQLVARAGCDPLQYLRDLPSCFFVESPQEFFASLSNAYFTDSWRTLDLAVKRFGEGKREPINQFLFFAGIYSNGTNQVPMYMLPASGRLTTSSAEATRVPTGITSIRRPTPTGFLTYSFQLDADGNVVAVSVGPGS